MSTLNGEQAKAALVELHRMTVAALERAPAEDFEGVDARLQDGLGIGLEDMLQLFKLRTTEIDVDSFVAGMFGGAYAAAAALSDRETSRPREDA